MNKNAYYFQISQALTSMNFWVALAIPYILFRGFEIEQAFALMSFYALINIIAEFPTGLIGDYFSHKISIILGNFLIIISMCLLVLELPLAGYYSVLGLAAVGASLIGGSDLALLKSISKNFKKDYSLMGSISDFVFFLSSILAGFLVNIDIRFPLIIGVIPYSIAIVLLFLIKKPSSENKAEKPENILIQSKLALSYVLKHKSVFIILLIAGILGGYAISIKTLAGAFSDVFEAPPQIIAWIVGFAFLTRALGKKLAPDMERFGYKILFILLMVTLLLLALANGLYLASFALIAGNFILGGLLILLNSQLVEETADGIEASVLSLRNLLVRTFSSAYLFIFGLILARNGFSGAVLVTLAIFLILGIIYFRSSALNKKPRDLGNKLTA